MPEPIVKAHPFDKLRAGSLAKNARRVGQPVPVL